MKLLNLYTGKAEKVTKVTRETENFAFIEVGTKDYKVSKKTFRVVGSDKFMLCNVSPAVSLRWNKENYRPSK